MFKDTCTRVCEYGDVAYDELNDPDNYNGEDCHCSKCKNFELCRTWTPLGVCKDCSQTYSDQLPEVYQQGTCDICTSDNVALYLHPACNTHAMCGTCLHSILVNGRPDQPLPSEYGLHRTCDCEATVAQWGTNECDECAAEVQAWEQTLDGVLWAEACIDQANEFAPSKACPFCRAEINQ